MKIIEHGRYYKDKLNVKCNKCDCKYEIKKEDIKKYEKPKKVWVTFLPVYKEIGLNDSNSIRLDLNFNEIPIEKLTKKYKFTYEPPEDTWGDMLAKGKNTYRDEPKVYYEVEALDTYQKLQLFDFELNEIPKKGDKWLVIEDRLDTLLGDNNYKLPFVKVNREITDIKAWEKEENYDS